MKPLLYITIGLTILFSISWLLAQDVPSKQVQSNGEKLTLIEEGASHKTYLREDGMYVTEFYAIEPNQFRVRADTTAYPDASPETSTVDGYVQNFNGSCDTFANIRGAATGSGASDSATTLQIQLDTSSCTGSNVKSIIRSFTLFDTSAIPDTDTISSATLSVYGVTKRNSSGSPDLHVSASNPASNTAIATGDYDAISDTSFGSLSYASFTNSAYNDITLNSSGEAAISKTGVTKFALRTSWDINNDTTGITFEAADDSALIVSSADVTGTSQDPKLVVVHSAAATTNAGAAAMMGATF